MGSITVNSTVMRSKATAFATVARNLENYTQDMLTEVKNLKSVWSGDAQEETIKLFEGYKTTFEAICADIMSYSKFLENAAKNYDKTETQNIQNARTR